MEPPTSCAAEGVATSPEAAATVPATELATDGVAESEEAPATAVDSGTARLAAPLRLLADEIEAVGASGTLGVAVSSEAPETALSAA